MTIALQIFNRISIISFLCISSISGFSFTRKCAFRKRCIHRATSANKSVSRGISQLHCIIKNTGDDSPEVAESVLNVTGVTLKMAFDTSYAVADASELKSERFTCPQSLDMVHKLRRWSDAVLVGRGTVERDNCTLTVRRVPLLPNSKSQPARVVLDPSLKIIEGEKQYALLNDGHEVLVYHCMDGSSSAIKQTSVTENVKLINVSTKAGRLSIRDILKNLKANNIHHVMVEGGPMTARQFLLENLVDRAILVRAPVTFIEPVHSEMNNEMFLKAGLELLKSEQCGDDTIEYWARSGERWPALEEFGDEMWPY